MYLKYTSSCISSIRPFLSFLRGSNWWRSLPTGIWLPNWTHKAYFCDIITTQHHIYHPTALGERGVDYDGSLFICLHADQDKLELQFVVGERVETQAFFTQRVPKRYFLDGRRIKHRGRPSNISSKCYGFESSTWLQILFPFNTPTIAQIYMVEGYCVHKQVAGALLTGWPWQDSWFWRPHVIPFCTPKTRTTPTPAPRAQPFPSVFLRGLYMVLIILK